MSAVDGRREDSQLMANATTSRSPDGFKRRRYGWGQAASDTGPGLFRFSAANFLVAILLLIVTAPLAEQLRLLP